MNVSGRIGDTRQRIKEEAMRLFVEHGVSNVSVRDIADAVGMKAPNLYAHFRSREDMVHELFAEGYRSYATRLVQASQNSVHLDEQLEGMIRLLCRLHDEDQVRFRFLLTCEGRRIAHWARGPEQNPADTLDRVIAAAIARGEIAPAEPAMLSAMILGAITGAAIFIHSGRIALTMEEAADSLVEACLRLAHAMETCG